MILYTESMLISRTHNLFFFFLVLGTGRFRMGLGASCKYSQGRCKSRSYQMDTPPCVCRHISWIRAVDLGLIVVLDPTYLQWTEGDHMESGTGYASMVIYPPPSSFTLSRSFSSAYIFLQGSISDRSSLKLQRTKREC